jgi:uncharacterized integral membrane protein
VGGTLLKWLVLLLAVTAFALSNQAPVTVSFWQWRIYNGPLAIVIIGAAVIGALLTYISSVSHHLRQSQQIRSLQDSARAQEARPAAPAQTSPGQAPPTPSRPVEDTRRLS